MTVIGEGLLLNSKYIKMGGEVQSDEPLSSSYGRKAVDG